MSEGLTAYDLVQQVYYVQEKVILDFLPSDDKFMEVVMEANLVLQELQKEEDWSWLRQRIVLGDCFPNGGAGQIPEFKLPSWVYKVSTQFDDCLQLHRAVRHFHGPSCRDEVILDERDVIEVPWQSKGAAHRRFRTQPYDRFRGTMNADVDLRAVCVGDVVTFNRILTPYEAMRVAVTDVQRRIGQIPMPTHDSADDDPIWREERYLPEIPAPNYVVVKTAASHCVGSPAASSRQMDLNDQAQKLLSAMRQNDASMTDSDYLDWDQFGYVGVM